MSMIGEYARLTAAELERAVGDPEWAHDFVDEILDAAVGADDDPADLRCHDVDKAWDGIAFLLRRTGFPVNVVYGEEEMPGAGDWGYGPPRYLTPARVATAAQALTGLSGADLVSGVSPDDLAKAEVYPAIWTDVESLEYIRRHYEALVAFFGAAARDGDAVLVWLD